MTTSMTARNSIAFTDNRAADAFPAPNSFEIRVLQNMNVNICTEHRYHMLHTCDGICIRKQAVIRLNLAAAAAPYGMK